MNILAIGAHPDDIELGCGGTLLLCAQKKKYNVYGLVLTDGEASGNPSKRIQEMNKSAEILKMDDLFFGKLNDTKISEGVETINVIENVINKVKPDIVITHTIKDSHQDHRNTALATFSAARFVKSVLCYESPSILNAFLPQYFVNINDTINEKIKCLQLFKSQFGKRYFEDETIKGLARYRGYQAKIKNAEAYEVFRITKNSNNFLG